MAANPEVFCLSCGAMHSVRPTKGRREPEDTRRTGNAVRRLRAKGHTHTVIAAVLGITRSTVAYHLRKGKD